MNLVQRVQDILLKPKQTWPVVAAESGDTASLYKNYIVILAAIAPIAGFIGMSLVGVGAFGMNVRVPILSGLVSAVVSYVVSLAMVFVLALIVDALAPTFGGTKNQFNALKVVAYSIALMAYCPNTVCKAMVCTVCLMCKHKRFYKCVCNA